MRAHFFRLVPFTVPGAAAPLAIQITGTVALGTGVVDITYLLSGATQHVKYASAGTQASRQNDLWRTTCFELFMKLPASPEYWEYNLAPNGDWNVYRFTGYRSALQPELQITKLHLVAGISPAGLASLQGKLPLPSSLADQQLVVGISSVIEDHEGRLHYFALRHGGAKPDFHDPTGFDIKLGPAPA